jgi:hypothetical protein
VVGRGTDGGPDRLGPRLPGWVCQPAPRETQLG